MLGAGCKQAHGAAIDGMVGALPVRFETDGASLGQRFQMPRHGGLHKACLHHPVAATAATLFGEMVQDGKAGGWCGAAGLEAAILKDRGAASEVAIIVDRR